MADLGLTAQDISRGIVETVARLDARFADAPTETT
jgi:hypothetical protein